METMKDYVTSKANKNLLKAYALKKLSSKETTSELIFNIFDLLIEDTTESILEKGTLGAWEPTNENIATVNLEIWAALRPRMESSLSAAPMNPQTKLNELFMASENSMNRDERESNNMQREPLDHEKTFMF